MAGLAPNRLSHRPSRTVHRPFRRTYLPLVCGLAVLAGCSPPEGDGTPVAAEGVTVVDSAGITIVTSAEPQWDESSRWRVAAEPVVSIGGGDEVVGALMVYRAVSGTWLGPDRFAVTQASSNVRVFDLSGNLMSEAGQEGEGEGPGEYGRIDFLGRMGDSIVVADAVLRRISVLDGEGRWGRSLGLAAPESGLPTQLSLAGGELVGRLRARYVANSEEVDRKRDSIVAVDLGTGEMELLGRPWGAIYFWTEVAPGMRFTLAHAYTPSASVTAAADRVVYGSSDRYELREVDLDGRLLRILRRVLEPAPLPAEALEATMERWRATGSAPVAEPRFLENLPFFDRLLLDETGHLWVRRHLAHLDPRAWDVFDPEGAWLGEIRLPARTTPLAISDRYILAVRRDDLDVEVIEALEILKGGS